MRIHENLNKDIQLARLYRSIAVLFELGTFYAIALVLIDLVKWAATWI